MHKLIMDPRAGTEATAKLDMDRAVSIVLAMLLLVAAHAPSTAQQAIQAAERHRVVAAVEQNLIVHYVDRAMGRKMADALAARETAGDDAAPGDGEAFAALLTRQLRDVSHDMHLELVYSDDPLPGRREPSPEEIAAFRERMKQQNCMIEKVEVLKENIGYFKFNWFADPVACADSARQAMAKLNGCDALIFDLRDNRGGDPQMVMLIAARLFDHPEYIFNPREVPSEQSWTKSPVEGNKIADKPVYLLVSHSTYSGAEDFAYNLKMLRRATLVGETTGGGAHAGVFHRIDDHFGIAITEVKAVNPYSNADWEGVGVTPDVKVNATDALETAQKLAESQVRHR